MNRREGWMTEQPVRDGEGSRVHTAWSCAPVSLATTRRHRGPTAPPCGEGPSVKLCGHLEEG